MNHIKFAIGGAPISQMYADEIGADGYGADASSAVDLFLYLVGKGDAPSAKSKLDTIKTQTPNPSSRCSTGAIFHPR